MKFERKTNWMTALKNYKGKRGTQGGEKRRGK